MQVSYVVVSLVLLIFNLDHVSSFSPAPTPSATSTPSASPELFIDCFDSEGSFTPCETPTATPTPSLSPTSTPSATPEIIADCFDSNGEFIPCGIPTPSLFPYLRINLGSTSAVGEFDGDKGQFVTGSSSIYTGFSGSGVDRSHRSGKVFGLDIDSVPDDYPVEVVLHFYENWTPACKKNARVFEVTVGDQSPEVIDVFGEVGCQTPLKKVYKNVKFQNSLKVSFEASIQNAYVSGIEIFGPKPIEPTATPEPTDLPSEIRVNLGADTQVGKFIGDDGTYVVDSARSSRGAGDGIYASHRWGSGFGIEIPVKDGEYNVSLHFMENYVKNCAANRRVFDVSVNGEVLKDLDIYNEAGCLKPTTKVFKRVKVIGKVVVTLKAKAQRAFLSGIEIQQTVPSKDEIVFESTNVKNFDPQGVTNIAIGPDLRYYMTTFDGSVIAAAIDEGNDYTVKSSCKSAKLLDSKWIDKRSGKPARRIALGIAFNPKDAKVKAYVSTSTLFWGPGEADILDADFAWANGQVEVLEEGGDCLERTETAITGLPVSNHDSSVNGLLFDQDGNLRIQVGSFTNQGIPGSKFGGLDENPLSAASLIALTSKGASFNGEITYDNKVPELAKQTGGDVEVYASGIHNSYGLVLHTSGKYFATTNAPNTGFGKRSVTCSTELPDKGHGDKIIQMEKGKFYGHPNRNRNECVFIDDNDKTPSGEAPPVALNYGGTFAKVPSSTNGIMEYTANTFKGKLKGDLFASKYAASGGGKVFHMKLSRTGEKESDPEQFFDFESGLSVVHGPRGEIIMPQVRKKKIVVLAPSYDAPDVLTVLGVTPFRGTTSGGNVVLVTGHNFGKTATALFGGTPCAEVNDVTETSFLCTTPAGSGLVDVTVKSGDASETVSDAFWYMNV